MLMKNLIHPGEIIRHDCLRPLGLSVGAAAKHLGVSKKYLDDFVNCRVGLTADLAIRLSKAFGSTPEGWYNIQMAYDLSQAQKHVHKINVKPAKAA